MHRYWIRIALGALLVFGLGLGALAAVQKGKVEVRNLLGTFATRLPLQLGNIAFRLDGRRLGEWSGLEVQRTGADDPGRVTIHVDLSDAGSIAEVRDCNLAVDDLHRVNNRTSFSCATEAELGSGNLVNLGEVVFRPGDLRRPLYLPRQTAEEWRRSEIRQLDASLARDGRGGLRAQGSFDVLDRERGPQRGTFDFHADSEGAALSVKNDHNQPILSFSANHHGLNLNLSDRHGRNLIRLLADSLGAAFRITK